jgi:hypothetical protein
MPNRYLVSLSFMHPCLLRGVFVKTYDLEWEHSSLFDHRPSRATLRKQSQAAADFPRV